MIRSDPIRYDMIRCVVQKWIAFMGKQLENAYSFLDNAFKWKVIRRPCCRSRVGKEEIRAVLPKRSLPNKGALSSLKIFEGKRSQQRSGPWEKVEKTAARAQKSSLAIPVNLKRKETILLPQQGAVSSLENFSEIRDAKSKFINKFNKLLI